MVLDLLLATFLYLLDFFFSNDFEKGSAPQKQIPNYSAEVHGNYSFSKVKYAEKLTIKSISKVWDFGKCVSFKFCTLSKG